MGQQQLLLLVLGIVIVGLAVVVGIQAFGENQVKANQDAIVNDGVRIASDLQAWALKPTAFGGGQGDFHAGTSNTEVTFTDLGYETGGEGCAAEEYGNLNACYALSVNSADEVVVTGTSNLETDGSPANVVAVTVAGTDPDDITTDVDAGSTD